MIVNSETPNMEQIEAMKKIVLNRIMTKDARERLGRLKLVKPDLASQLELYLIQIYQSGKVEGQITDEQLKSILEMMSSKKEFNIQKR
jgi:programmed cell death protein 5